jgi:hypothetical protein
MCDRAIYCGFNGIGRAGADYFRGAWCDGFRGSQWNMVGRAAVQTLWPGKDRVESSVRNEVMLEGIQEAEARTFLEQALDRKVLPDDLAAEVSGVLDGHIRGTLHIAAGGIDYETMDSTAHWQARSRRLYQAAAKVARQIGVDVDRTAFGQDVLSITASGEKATLAGAKVLVPALGKKRLTVKLRNWSDKPRVWKAASAEAWIVPEKSQGNLLGQQELGIILDGKTLKAGEDIPGTLTITDVAAGTTYPITVAARGEKAIELRVRQEIDFITGGGSGAESPKTIHIETEPVFNVPMGGTQTKEYPLVSRAADKQAWKITSDCDWLAAEPASGEIAPGATVMLRFTARPKDAAGAYHEPTITLTAAAGAIQEQYRIKTYVIPPYQAPGVPHGEAVYLNELDPKKSLKSHVDAGFAKGSAGDKKRIRPWIFSDPPVPYYHRFHRADQPSDGAKRETYETSPYTMGGKTFRRGLWVSPNHETVYHIEGAGFTAFAAEVGFFDVLAKRANMNIGSPLSFEIYVDGKLRAQSGLVKFGERPRLLVVDNLQSAKELKLVTRRDDLVNDWYTVATWGDPRLIRGK